MSQLTRGVELWNALLVVRIRAGGIMSCTALQCIMLLLGVISRTLQACLAGALGCAAAERQTRRTSTAAATTAPAPRAASAPSAAAPGSAAAPATAATPAPPAPPAASANSPAAAGACRAATSAATTPTSASTACARGAAAQSSRAATAASASPSARRASCATTRRTDACRPTVGRRGRRAARRRTGPAAPATSAWCALTGRATAAGLTASRAALRWSRPVRAGVAESVAVIACAWGGRMSLRPHRLRLGQRTVRLQSRPGRDPHAFAGVTW